MEKKTGFLEPSRNMFIHYIDIPRKQLFEVKENNIHSKQHVYIVFIGAVTKL